MKCPFCDSVHVLKDGFDQESMDIWRCMSCGETITQKDLDDQKEKDLIDDQVEFGEEDSAHIVVIHRIYPPDD